MNLGFNHLDIKQKYTYAHSPLSKPEKFDEMIRLAKRLSNGFALVRVELY